VKATEVAVGDPPRHGTSVQTGGREVAGRNDAMTRSRKTHHDPIRLTHRAQPANPALREVRVSTLAP
jgi:hypothetical protein